LTGRTLWHAYLAVSLDGRIARPDGGVADWLAADYPPDGFGYAAFFASVDAILMGRGSYEALWAMGDWPYAGKRTLVVTSRPLPGAPAGVESVSGGLARAADALEGDRHRHVWVFGGGQIVRGMIALGRLDRLELAVIPVILGEGISLFPPGTPETRLELEACTPRLKGAVHLVYRRAA